MTTPLQALQTALADRRRREGLEDVAIELSDHVCPPGTIRLETIWNHGETGTGRGGRALDLLVELADAHGLALQLYVHFLRYDLDDDDCDDVDHLAALNASYLDNRQLIAWYGRRGFIAASPHVSAGEENIHMVRPPRPAPVHTPTP